ncbi:DUF4214 domain-containing protein [Pseudoduganella danionis]|uniref:DUF4214 domain-containing protein n=1 Tax=Pseudoduganella danionis TaxID=1890295 RepID=A0ABW9SVL3_9BURK|nr:DUF4214 domain-containing protein [Pseudoduganella danionis]MTW35188.1 DUF4214 domain-containing protein [Pseudoduganella danionis]
MKILKNALLGCFVLILVACGGTSTPPSAAKIAGAMRSGGPIIAGDSYNDVVQQIYVAYFGRPADAGGLTYYENTLVNAAAPTTLQGLLGAYYSNAAVKAVVDSFGTSAESAALYNGNTSAFVTAIYQYTFNRPPDAAGLNYWSNLIDSGAVTRGNAALSIMAGAQSTDATIVANKTRAASNFTVALDSSLKQASYSGLAANVVARTMLSQVNESTNQTAFLNTINQTIDKLVTNYTTPPPSVSNYSPSTATAGYPTTFTFTGSNLVAGMSFSLNGCYSAYEVYGGTSTQRQFNCVPQNPGTYSGTLRSSANGSVLGTFTVTVYAPQPGTSGGDYSTSFSIGESSEASFVLTGANPRHLSTSDTFTITSTETVWAFTAAQYAVNIYALDATNAQLFLNGQAFQGYLLCGTQGSTGMCFPTLPAGKYWIGTVPNQTIFSSYSNPVYHEVSTNHKLSRWYQNDSVGMYAGGNPGAWKSQGFTIPSNAVRAYIETEGYGGKFVVMTPAQYNSFAAAYPNGFFSGSYSYIYACGETSGNPDIEIECELKLPAGSYYLVWFNDTRGWAGSAANIAFYLPQ